MKKKEKNEIKPKHQQKNSMRLYQLGRNSN